MLRNIYRYYAPLPKNMPKLSSAQSLKEIPSKYLRKAIKVSQQYIPTGVNHIYSYKLSDEITLSKCFATENENSESSNIFYQLQFEVAYNYFDELSIQPFTEVICMNDNEEQTYAGALDIIENSINVRKTYSSSSHANSHHTSSRVTYHVSAICIVPESFINALQKASKFALLHLLRGVRLD